MKNIQQNIAIVGASGNVGRKTLEVMQARDFVCDQLFLFASSRSAGQSLSFNGRAVKIAPLDSADFTSINLAFFAAGSKVARAYAPQAAQAGAVVIDHSSYFRMEEDVPLIVPEINGNVLKRPPKRNIIANPNCSTAQFVMALAPLHRAKKIERVHVATYQSASGAGRAAMDELMRDIKNGKSENSSLAFNVIPKIDAWGDHGETREEWKMRVETAKILDPAIKISTHCVRVPVLVGHSEAVFLRFAEPMGVDEAKNILSRAPGCELVKGDYATPRECEGRDPVFISRIRQDPSDKNALQMWITADNLLKGAALNAVQIAEKLIEIETLN